jgi:hypothetical protein
MSEAPEDTPRPAEPPPDCTFCRIINVAFYALAIVYLFHLLYVRLDAPPTS